MSNVGLTSWAQWLTSFVRSSASDSRSILPFLPRSLRWVLFLILLVNIRSWPGVWHGMSILSLKSTYRRPEWSTVRGMASALRLHFKRLIHWRKDRQVWWASVSPIGRTPFPTSDVEGPERSVQMVAKLWASEYSAFLHFSSNQSELRI